MITLNKKVLGFDRVDGWAPRKLHHVLKLRKNNKNDGLSESNLLSLSYGRIVRKDISSVFGLVPESYETYQIVEPGDIVLRLTDLQNDKRSLRQGYVRERGIVTSAYDAVKVSASECGRYWFYFLSALDTAKYYYSLGGGVRQTVKFADFPDEWVSAPCRQMQEAIAEFIDTSVICIDKAVQKKSMLLSLLAEQRRAVITAAIAAYPNAPSPMIGMVFDVESGATPDSKAEEFWGGDILWATPEDLGRIDGAYIFDTGRHITSAGFGSCGTTMIPAGSLVLSKRAPIGHVGIASTPLCFNQGCLGLIPRQEVSTKYAYYALLSLKERLQAAGQGTTFAEISRAKLRSTRMPLPDLKTQEEVAANLERQIAAIDASNEKVKRSIDLIKEYRSALITAAVTGQINVTDRTSLRVTERTLEDLETL